MRTTRAGGGLLSALVIGVVALMVIPLPGAVLDLLLSVNIALAVTLLLTTILSSRSLDMASTVSETRITREGRGIWSPRSPFG